MALAVSMVAVFLVLVMLAALILAMPMTCLILRHINIVVPPVTHEIDRLAASIVFAAVFAPVFLVTGGHMKVDGLMNNTDRRGVNHDGLCVNEFGLRIVPDINTAVEARLADTDRHTDIGCLRRDGKKDHHDGEQNVFHVCSPPLIFHT